MSKNAQLSRPASLPRTVHVEATSRCNLACAMCPKQAAGCHVPDQELPLALFRRALPGLAGADSLVLSGLGEPLLHPDLPDMVGMARAAMPPDGRIGFQSNGLLLTRDKATALLRAGLSRIFVSVDSADAQDSGELHGGAKLAGVETGLDALRLALAQVRPPRFELGVEFVLMRSTLPRLPGVIRWAARQGADRVLVSHVLPYRAEDAFEDIFVPDSAEALALFARWRDKAEADGLNLADYPGLPWKYAKTDADLRLMHLVRELIDTARLQGVSLNLSRLMRTGGRPPVDPTPALREAQDEAARLGVRLDLPPMASSRRLACQFMDNQAAVIAADGQVAPCMFLMRDLTCYPQGNRKLVRRTLFGNLADAPLSHIWNSPGFVRFREETASGAFADCFGCNLEPCSDVDGDTPYTHDCQGSIVPCGHCPWALGGLRCLG